MSFLGLSANVEIARIDELPAHASICRDIHSGSAAADELILPNIFHAAAVAMIDSLAEDLRGTNVRVNSILPSIIDTSANRRAMPDADFSKWPKPEEITRVILFLCSEEARLIHGASIPVYGNFAT